MNFVLFSAKYRCIIAVKAMPLLEKFSIECQTFHVCFGFVLPVLLSEFRGIHIVNFVLFSAK